MIKIWNYIVSSIVILLWLLSRLLVIAAFIYIILAGTGLLPESWDFMGLVYPLI